MKIERDIKEPEWLTPADPQENHLATNLKFADFITYMNVRGRFTWILFEKDSRENDLKAGNAGTLEQAKAAAWAAYLNLIFH